MTTWYKAVRKDRKSHYDEKTTWRKGAVIRVEDPDPPETGPCGRGIHASPNILGAVKYQQGPSRYCEVEPMEEPIAQDETKGRFAAVRCVRWLSKEEIDELAGFKLHEANNPINPLLLPKRTFSTSDVSAWASIGYSVKASVGYSVRDSVWDSVGGSVWASVKDSVWDSVKDSVWDSVWDSVRDSVRDSVWAYIGGLFPNIKQWHYVDVDNPWRPLLNLWYAGYVPSFDGETWRLYAGPKAEIVWKGER